MSRSKETKQLLKDIGDAIRYKEGSSAPIPVSEFPIRIRQLIENTSLPFTPSIIGGKVLGDYTWADIQRIARSGKAPETFNIGDLTEPILVKGTIGASEFNIPVRFRIIDFNHNASREGDNTISFMLATNEDNREIALIDSKYYLITSEYMPANVNALCMNRMGQIGLDNPDSTLDTNAQAYGPNKGGWEKSYGRVKICDDFYNALPRDLQAVIGLSTIYSDNVGNGVNVSSNMTITQDKIYFLSEVELFGVRKYSNSSSTSFQTQMEWFKGKNDSARVAYRSDVPTDACYWWEREPRYNYTYYFCLVGANGSANGGHAARSFGVRPAFKIS